jgi:hypothetical protein
VVVPFAQTRQEVAPVLVELRETNP